MFDNCQIVLGSIDAKVSKHRLNLFEIRLLQDHSQSNIQKLNISNLQDLENENRGDGRREEKLNIIF